MFAMVQNDFNIFKEASPNRFLKQGKSFVKNVLLFFELQIGH